jgi:hypothetical protein
MPVISAIPEVEIGGHRHVRQILEFYPRPTETKTLRVGHKICSNKPPRCFQNTLKSESQCSAIVRVKNLQTVTII